MVWEIITLNGITIKNFGVEKNMGNKNNKLQNLN